MLSTSHRLKKNREFSVVYRKGKRQSTKYLVLRTYRSGANSQKKPIRIGFSISQKVSKRAVVRNRIKRQLRAACRQLLPELQPGWDVVIVVRTAAVQCDYFLISDNN
ncbi:ribonuclease P protein component [Acaryochloris marina]|uniref:Ribonuclease P protein component n=1 Tax=Acaryochloris marina (strain MBIC 11017) TaxID=329726 RepID=B0CDM1_ACAM1|nr:ribonuclease P protein component [Acaryochloris marina]ABW28090.1 ribonuclease P protein component [Acaryochloris marina MBIC11017]